MLHVKIWSIAEYQVRCLYRQYIRLALQNAHNITRYHGGMCIPVLGMCMLWGPAPHETFARKEKWLGDSPLTWGYIRKEFHTRRIRSKESSEACELFARDRSWVF